MTAPAAQSWRADGERRKLFSYTAITSAARAVILRGRSKMSTFASIVEPPAQPARAHAAHKRVNQRGASLLHWTHPAR